MTAFDPGLQPERTALAWRRTAISLTLGSLVALRVLPAATGAVAWVFVGVAGLGVTAALWVAAGRRSARTIRILLRDGDRAPLPGALLLAALAGLVFLVGAGASALVLAHHLGVFESGF
ncbi:DUF202 domain-containing protein [Microbacterium sp. 77mftsu3.1]|uniref:DUF202 domain-containing protein n=1 Tax=Microbacterium sp. 77mftsu3.1 TaxID=1761802 RepID=UPI000360F7DC|nr:DUF202 domain-containing protein [Microbacterium sp. 77mftsu3.1]SDG68823.1 putative membrane protein [Microbacterium sp. 77mftsu3.1]